MQREDKTLSWREATKMAMSKQEMANSMLRKMHLDRMKKITDRKRFTSNTLDNYHQNPLVKEYLESDNNAMAMRKKAVKAEESFIIERENKALLKRISNVLTGPPTIDEGEYFRMRALCPSMRGPSQIYEEELQKKAHGVFMKQIKNTGAYYSRKKWEIDYRKQKTGQRFMRKVTYKRPKGFLDPFAPKKDTSNPELERLEIIERRKRANDNAPTAASFAAEMKASQVSRVKGIKSSRSAAVAFLTSIEVKGFGAKGIRP